MTFTVGVKFDDLGGDTLDINNLPLTEANSGEIASAINLVGGSSILSYGIRAASNTGAQTQVNIALYNSTAGVPTTKVVNSDQILTITALSGVVANFTQVLPTPVKVQTTGEYQIAMSVVTGQPALDYADRLAVAAGNQTSEDTVGSHDPLPATWSDDATVGSSPILFARIQEPLPNTTGFLEAPLFTFTSA